MNKLKLTPEQTTELLPLLGRRFRFEQNYSGPAWDKWKEEWMNWLVENKLTQKEIAFRCYKCKATNSFLPHIMHLWDGHHISVREALKHLDII